MNDETQRNSDNKQELVAETTSEGTNADAAVESDPVETEPEEKTESKEKSHKDKVKKNKPEKSRRFPFFSLFNFILILVLAGGVGWAGKNFLQEGKQKDARIDSLLNQLTAQQQTISGLESAIEAGKRSVQQQSAKADNRFKSLEQVQKAQNKRLLSMSTTSREDWLLAEAEYLLKLANQRVLIEKAPAGADALLVEADNILAGLEDPDLFSLREAIAKDLAAIRLTKKVDVEGIFLKISALAGSVDKLPTRPESSLNSSQSEESMLETDIQEESKTGFDKIEHGFQAFLNTFKSFIRITDHSQEPIPILVPEINQYARQNLVLMLEKSQLALLREQQEIYEGSLEQANNWIAQYFPHSEEAKLFTEQLGQLKEKNIKVDLPDITGSLELLHSYIEELHDLKGVQKPKDEK